MSKTQKQVFLGSAIFIAIVLVYTLGAVTYVSASTANCGARTFSNGEIYSTAYLGPDSCPFPCMACDGGGWYPDQSTASKLCQILGYDSATSFTPQYGFFTSPYNNYFRQWNGSYNNVCALTSGDIGIDTVTCSKICNITCSSSSECGTSGYTGSPFCQSGNVYQNYKTYTCSNPGTSSSSCSNSTNAQLIQTCTSNQTCQNGQCVASCSTHATKQCSGNAVYWYNSCGIKEDVFQTCASNQVCQNAQCVNVTCSSDSDCGTNGLVGSPFCKNNNVYKKFKTYTCNNPGTASSTCSNLDTDQQITVCTGSQTCSNGSCTQASVSTFCPSNSIQSNIFTSCQKNGQYWPNLCAPTHDISAQVAVATPLTLQYTVSSGHCASIRVHAIVDGQEKAVSSYLGHYGSLPSSTLPKTTNLNLGTVQPGNHTISIQGELDGVDCSGGNTGLASWAGIAVLTPSINQCPPAPVACSSNTDCGTNSYTGSPFCQGNSVYKNYTTYTCNSPGTANSYCSNSINAQLQTTCTSNQTCSNGSCSGQNCTYHSYQQCSGNTLYWYDSCGNQQDSQYCQNGCYNNSCNNYNNATVQTNAATNIYNNQATLNGYFYYYNSYNNYCTNYVWFQHGPTTSYGNETTHQSQNYTGAFSQNVNLYNNYYNTYHFRAAAQLCGGSTVYGQDTTFTSSGSVGNLTVNKTVKNLTTGSGWASSVSAGPSDMLMFMITLQATGNQNVYSAYVRDSFPANLIYKNQLVVSGSSNYSGDITSGITLNTISAGQTVTITYQAQVAPAQNFSYGTTTLNNSVSVTNSGSGYNPTSNASIFVTRSAVYGASTISTGLTNNFWIDSFFLPMLIALIGVWMWKSGMFFGIEKWFDNKRKVRRGYKAEKELSSRIAAIKNAKRA